jgi:hypothetical protein
MRTPILRAALLAVACLSLSPSGRARRAAVPNGVILFAGSDYVLSNGIDIPAGIICPPGGSEMDAWLSADG